MAPVPPPPSMASSPGLTATAHLATPEGLSEVFVDDPQAADTQASTRNATPGRRNPAEKVTVRLVHVGWARIGNDLPLEVAPGGAVRTCSERATPQLPYPATRSTCARI